MRSKYALGLDIGSVNVKLVLRNAGGDIVVADTEKVTTSPRVATGALLQRLRQNINLEEIGPIGLTGSGKGVVPKEFGWVEYSSSLALAAGVLQTDPSARTIIQVGGQSSLVIKLADGLRRPWQVATNPLCAAGTGRFLEQQAYRLGIGLEEFGTLALQCKGHPPRIAARCSVFAKSDLIHLQQKGVPVSDMLYGLCESIARMVASLAKGPSELPVYLAGGVAANPAFVRALNEILSARNGCPVEVIVPSNFLYTEALGAARLARGAAGLAAKGTVVHESEAGCPAAGEGVSEHEMTNANEVHRRPLTPALISELISLETGRSYLSMPPLPDTAFRNGHGVPQRITGPCEGYLGVDVGSTSTKGVILDATGSHVLAKYYLMTAGRPVEAVKELSRQLLALGGGQVTIRGVGVTGSGRYLVGSLIGADLVKNEITAQTRAAAEIDPDADIIEIGGQDSKLVLKRHGTVVDYQMNKACAAGTGSFIDELAEMLEVPVKNGHFAGLAFAAPETIDLGTRCAAFMSQAVAYAQQDAVPAEVITASLAVAIARNYLSKVVGTRKLGPKVILTGAVFYNRAVEAAFRQQLPDRTLVVPEHKEISGAIGAALLAREAVMAEDGRSSHFKGLAAVAASEPKLTTFTCQACANNCAITRMQAKGESATYYGSRCDRYDAAAGKARGKTETFFDERERLLFRDYRPGAGTGPKVAVPRALLVYDFAPLLLGFLNNLGARALLSDPTSREITEQAVELSYTDSCFPIKLLHGHVATVADADFILYPSMIRLSGKEGDENQHYACPLVQASPFIARTALGLEQKLLAPPIDFSRGPEAVVKSLTEAARRMGYSAAQGKRAALAGLAAQERFASSQAEIGARLLAEARAGDAPGVVLFARSYMSQDAGANLGIAEKLAELGVVPIPMDFLPLDKVAASEYSDRPYWHYESKQVAAAALVAEDPNLYGLILTNFGCGPNSFILRMVEDIMGNKPLGQLEIDEHAAEAGIVTRLEAFVDTIQAHRKSGTVTRVPSEQVYRGTTAVISNQKTLLLPLMAPHAHVLRAAMEAHGVRAIVLPEPDERNLLYANQVTTGVECLPYRVSLGDFIRAHYELNGELKNAEAFMAGSYGPCRLGKYATEQMHVLRDMGINLPIRSTVSNNAYRDLGLGDGFERMAWRALVVMDYLQKLLWRTRPYEREAGSADHLFEEYTERLAGRVQRKAAFDNLASLAVGDFRALRDPALPRRPRVGVNGEIFLRANDFSNQNLVRACEAAGLEVIVSPMSEWFRYTAFRNTEDAWRDRKVKKLAISYAKQLVMQHDERKLVGRAGGNGDVDGHEPSTGELLARSERWLSPLCGSEAVLSLGSAAEWMESSEFAGVISVMPHGCMPGGIVAAMSEKLSTHYGKPWINLTYDGFMETNNLARINNFAEVIRFAQSQPGSEVN